MNHLELEKLANEIRKSIVTAVHSAADYGSRALHGLHDLLGRLIDEVMVERLQFDSNFLVHMFFLF